MNRGAFHTPSSSVHQMMVGGSPAAASLWSLDNMRPTTTVAAAAAAAHPHQQTYSLLPSSSSSSTTTSSSSSSSVLFPSQYSHPTSDLQPLAPWHDNQDRQLPESWSQLLMGGLVGEEDRCSFTPFQTKKMENWEDHAIYPSLSAHINVDIKQELSDKGYNFGQAAREEIQASRPSWTQILPDSSPMSSVTTSFINSSMLDFSNSKPEFRLQHQLDHSSQECNSTPAGSPYKKARVQASSGFKVRKEKLGDRITSLHQLVSPFGKTDTASVLLEAIGYIRFLQGQIEALSSPYLAPTHLKQQQTSAQGERSCIFPEDPGQLLNDNSIKRRGALDPQDGIDHEPKKDLRSRGLCLVPVSFTLHVGSDNGADYWAPTFGGGFR